MIRDLYQLAGEFRWGATVGGRMFRGSSLNRFDMMDVDPLRKVEDILNSKYATCNEFSMLMGHILKKGGKEFKYVATIFSDTSLHSACILEGKIYSWVNGKLVIDPYVEDYQPVSLWENMSRMEILGQMGGAI